MTESRSAMAFARAATNCDVAESDFLVLCEAGITTYERMAYRLPNTSDLEDFLKNTIRVKSGYKYEDGKVIIFDKQTPEPWGAYKSKDDPGCLRKLWNMSLQIAKKELEALASPEDATARKVTLTMAQEMETRAMGEGMTPPLSDKERPSLLALSKVIQAYGPSGTFQYLSWEVYLDREHEGRLRRAGKLPKDHQELVTIGERVVIKNKDTEISVQVDISEPMDMRECLDVRGKAFHMCKICNYEICRQLTERYLSKMRATQVDGMRAPTLNEIRRFDRELFEEILSHVAKSEGSIQNGLKHYLENPTEALWKLPDPQLASHPDQGKEKPIKAKPDSKRPKSPKKGPSSSSKRPATGESKEWTTARRCIVCGKRHEPRCPLPPNFRKEQKERAKAERGKGGGKKGKNKGKKEAEEKREEDKP